MVCKHISILPESCVVGLSVTVPLSAVAVSFLHIVYRSAGFSSYEPRRPSMRWRSHSWVLSNHYYIVTGLDHTRLQTQPSFWSQLHTCEVSWLHLARLWGYYTENLSAERQADIFVFFTNYWFIDLLPIITCYINHDYCCTFLFERIFQQTTCSILYVSTNMG